jgi:hypothetical protein
LREQHGVIPTTWYEKNMMSKDSMSNVESPTNDGDASLSRIVPIDIWTFKLHFDIALLKHIFRTNIATIFNLQKTFATKSHLVGLNKLHIGH